MVETLAPAWRPGEHGALLSNHDRLIGSLPQPAWLKGGALLDHRWRIRMDDPAIRRDGEWEARFDVVLAPGGILSTHPDFEHDLITAKMLVYHAQSPRFLGGISSTTPYTPVIAREYFSFVRWRASRGIPTNRDLSPEWLEEMFSVLRKKGPMQLLPLEERMAAYVESLEARGMTVPVWDGIVGRGVAITTVAHAIGLNNPNSIPESALSILREASRRHGIDARIRGGPEPTWRPGRRFIHKRDGVGGYTPSRLHLFLRPIELLYRYQHHLTHDPIGFDPFPQERSSWQMARTLATVKGGRTATIPAAQACHLINQALTWVLEYGPDIRRLVDGVRDSVDDARVGPDLRSRRLLSAAKSFVPTSPSEILGSPWPLNARNTKIRPSGRPSIRSVALRHLPAACMIVIAAFSARRHEEIDSLRDSCIQSEGDDHYLETWIGKTIRDTNKIPVPMAVAKAVETLQWLSAVRRAQTGRDWLFDFQGLLPSAKGRFNAGRCIPEFAKFVGVPELPDGQHWWFAPHQFRRFFGIVYYHHYSLPHLAALSNFYRHFDLDMTRVYINEVADGGFLRRAEERRVKATAHERRLQHREQERLADFRAEALNFRVKRYQAILAREERASGFGGELLTKELDALYEAYRASVEIVTDPAVESELDRLLIEFAQCRVLEPNPHGHSYCKCTSELSDLQVAGCIRMRSEEVVPVAFLTAPDPAHASDVVCSGCPHNVQLPENESYWRGLAEREARQAECGAGPLIRVLAERRRQVAINHLDRCF